MPHSAEREVQRDSPSVSVQRELDQDGVVLMVEVVAKKGAVKPEMGGGWSGCTRTYRAVYCRLESIVLSTT